MTEFAVVVVLDDPLALLARRTEKFRSSGKRHGETEWVLMRWRYVKRSRRRKMLVRIRYHEARCVYGYGYDFRAYAYASIRRRLPFGRSATVWAASTSRNRCCMSWRRCSPSRRRSRHGPP